MNEQNQFHNIDPNDVSQNTYNTLPEEKALSLYKPRVKRKPRIFKSTVFTAVISSLLTCSLCLGAFSLSFFKENPTNASNPPTAQGSTLGSLNSGNVSSTAQSSAQNIPDVYDKASPAVVSILCAQQNGSYMQSAMSSGSGIIIHKDGYVATNNHVVEGASAITVQTIAGQSFKANIVGTDARTDLAVLKVETKEALPYAVLGDSSEIRVGDMALAIGNPLREELAGTLTVGYISAINRSMVIDGKQMTMLQTDAAINPGNSGGALLNMKGEVIGINTAKSTGYDVEGLGFAIPINEAKPILESIIEHGYVTGRPVIGIGGIDVTEAIAKANDLPMGVYVKTVSEFSAAERAGIKTGDVIVEFDGKKVKSIDDINEIKNAHKVGDTLSVKLIRSGKTVKTELTLLEEKPQEATQTETQTIPETQIPSDFFSWFNW